MVLQAFGQNAAAKKVSFRAKKHVPIQYDNRHPETGSPAQPQGALPQDLKGNYTLIFADEFNDKEIHYEQAPHPPVTSLRTQWDLISQLAGDDPVIHPSIDHIYLQNGHLVLKTSAKQIPETGKITGETAAIQSRMYYRFGYIEARVKIPYRSARKTGLFPAFWLYRRSERYEEFDIFEFFQHLDPQNKFTYKASQHYDDKRLKSEPYFHTGTLDRDIMPVISQQGKWYNLNMAKDFFIWGLRWTPDSLIYYLNHQRIGAMPNRYSVANTYCQDGKHIIFNVRPVWQAIRDTSDFPCYFEVDYVRVYKEEKDFDWILRTGTEEGESLPDQFPRGRHFFYGMEDYIPGMEADFAFLSPEGKVLAANPNATSRDPYKCFFTYDIPKDLPLSPDYQIRLHLKIPKPDGSGFIEKTLLRKMAIVAAPH